jgi:Family of unknown function (DUF6159)
LPFSLPDAGAVSVAAGAGVVVAVLADARAARACSTGVATAGGSIGFAFKRLGPILGWSVVGTVVTLLLAFVRSRGAAGALIAGGGGAAWSLVTFLAVPVIAFEGLGPFAKLKRSASLFRQHWGEQITGNVGIGLVFSSLLSPGFSSPGSAWRSPRGRRARSAGCWW